LKELFTRDGSGILISRDMYEGARPARDSDLRSIMEILSPLVEEGILAPRTKEDVRKEFPNTFVLALDGAIVACGVLKRYSPTSAEIACVAVHPQYRRGGRGELLLAYLERRALLMGVTQVKRTFLWVYCRCRPLLPTPTLSNLVPLLLHFYIPLFPIPLFYYSHILYSHPLSYSPIPIFPYIPLPDSKVFVLSTRTMQWFEERGFRLSSPSLLPATRNYNAARASRVYIKELGTTRDVEVEELLWNIA
jgi:N-acetylglutamate synthase-like GNAT family acetyltransferase